MGQIVGQRHIHKRPLAAEVAANAARVNADLLLGQIPYGGQLVAQHKGAFVVGPNLHPAGGVNIDHAGVGFQISLVHQLGRKGMLKNQVRFGKAAVNIALVPDIMGEYIVDRGQGFRQAGIGGQVFVEGRGVIRHCHGRVKDGRQFGVFHLDQQQGLLGDVRAFGGDGGHLFTDEQNLIPGQDRAVPQQAADPPVGKILAGQNGVDAGQFFGAAGVNADDAGVGKGTSQNLPPKHTGQGNVGGIDRPPRNLVRALAANYGLADSGVGSSHKRPPE